MATSNDPIFSTGFGNLVAKATAAKTTFTDATNAVRFTSAGASWEAGAEGAILTRMKARCLGAGSIGATVCYIFTSADDGATLCLKGAKLFTAQTVSTTVPSAEVDFEASFDDPIQLAPGEWLYAAVSVANVTGFQFEGSFEDFAA
ncbi:hypothetical protein [Phenylobacterium sp.]|uniref:hypothetical protein n=1 Tax=Phenylobacterium sp. TaxID=1871053 RepID=UPI003BAD3EF5